MAIQEWMNEDSEQYQKVLRFNDHDHPLMHTAPGQKIDCEIDEAYAYLTKQNHLVIGIVPRVVFGVNMVMYPDIAGEYVVNRVVGKDTVAQPHRYLINHQQLIKLDDFNHIIDLNKPDVLDPQMIFENQYNYKNIVHQWVEHRWISPKADEIVAKLPEGRSDLIDERIPEFVSKHAGFRRALSEWRENNWVSKKQAQEYAVTGQPLKTLDDELSFTTEL